MENRKSITTAYITIVFIYLLAFFIIYFLYSREILSSTMVDVLFADVVATVLVFLFSMIFKNSSIYDPYWSVVPPVIVLYLIMQFPDGNSIRQIIVFGLTAFWSLRLTLNWFRGWKGFKHQDWRYTYLSEKTGKMYWLVSFLGIHLVPTLVVFLGCLPFWYALSSPEPINFIDIFASLFTFSAILTEWIADEQLKRFKKQDSKNSFMSSGLWAYSRHPNYLGEICFWIGIFLFVVASSNMNGFMGFWTALGWLGMILLFTFISIPMMERRNKENKPGYKAYVVNVPALCPRIFRQSKKN